MMKKIGFTWDIHRDCNYRCPYCWFFDKWDTIKSTNYYPGVDLVAGTWQRIFERYGSVHLEIVGGEPLTYPDFDQLLPKILAHHTVGVTTNLSKDITPFIQGIGGLKNNLEWHATFHPLFSKLDAFLAKAKALKESGHRINVMYLAWPGQLKDLKKSEETFKNNGFIFSILTFWGAFEGRQYPAAYTEEERLIIDPGLGVRGDQPFQTKPLSTKGRLCNAGHTYGVIAPDGSMIRCGGGGFGGKEEKVGNIFDPNFTFFESPRPCSVDVCPCNEWAELLVDKD